MKIILLFSILSFSILSLQSQNSLFEFQNDNSIDKYLEKNKLSCDKSELFIFKNFDSFITYNNNGYLVGPIVHVFNSDGIYLENFKLSEVIDKLSNFKNIRKKPKKKAINIDSWINKIINYKTLKPLLKQDNKDYYFVLNWAIFFNKDINNEALFKWYEVLKRQKLNGKDIQVILINMDLQDSWDLSEEKKESILKQANK
ncbi:MULTISPECIES: hypothetical protein [Winogradskyella]|uniref:hypothetical protein n=1 Tax=Winogradskyella TaxID=286104 RepID=UPI0015C6DE76|nr:MULTISPECIES: hypothetical protein [Winogradskyella]QXP78692.1 hypothetical protein H0I32_16035 [Winogradskyella sp. HaHa_3_26]